MKKRLLLFALLTATALAQNAEFSGPTEGEIHMLRKDVRSEWRANLIIELQLASQVPLIEPNSKFTIPTEVTQ